MKTHEIVQYLNESNINAEIDLIDSTLIKMPDGVFYDSADFYITNAYWENGERFEKEALVYNGECSFNAEIFVKSRGQI